MNFIGLLKMAMIFLIGLLFWYSVAAVALDLWNRWTPPPRFRSRNWAGESRPLR